MSHRKCKLLFFKKVAHFKLKISHYLILILKEGQVIFFSSQNTPGVSHENSLPHPPKQP